MLMLCSILLVASSSWFIAICFRPLILALAFQHVLGVFVLLFVPGPRCGPGGRGGAGTCVETRLRCGASTMPLFVWLLALSHGFWDLQCLPYFLWPGPVCWMETHRVENCPLRFMLLFRLEATCVWFAGTPVTGQYAAVVCQCDDQLWGRGRGTIAGCHCRVPL